VPHCRLDGSGSWRGGLGNLPACALHPNILSRRLVFRFLGIRLPSRAPRVWIDLSEQPRVWIELVEPPRENLPVDPCARAAQADSAHRIACALRQYGAAFALAVQRSPRPKLIGLLTADRRAFVCSRVGARTCGKPRMACSRSRRCRRLRARGRR
jgi:hypothetical protein